MRRDSGAVNRRRRINVPLHVCQEMRLAAKIYREPNAAQEPTVTSQTPHIPDQQYAA
jgi:hypothetical protein